MTQHTPCLTLIAEGLNAATDNAGSWSPQTMRDHLQHLRVETDKALDQHNAMVSALSKISDGSAFPGIFSKWQNARKVAKEALNTTEECWICSGRGYVNDDCTCATSKCDSCKGTGKGEGTP